MADSQSYPPSVVIGSVAADLRNKHPDRRLQMACKPARYDEALKAATACVTDIEDTIILPTWDSDRRSRVRAMALDHQSPDPRPMPIRTPGRIQSVECPTPLPPSHRGIFKENIHPRDMQDRKEPYPVTLHAKETEGRRFSVAANLTMTAVDWDEGMPECHLRQVDALWDTGAHGIVISDDILDETFKAHLRNDDIHDAYRGQNGVCVHTSFILEATNTMFTMETTATVVDRSVLPNRRSGVILGQRGCIDHIAYECVPRVILEAEGERVDRGTWGDLVIGKYLNFDGVVKHVN